MDDSIGEECQEILKTRCETGINKQDCVSRLSEHDM